MKDKSLFETFVGGGTDDLTTRVSSGACAVIKTKFFEERDLKDDGSEYFMAFLDEDDYVRRAHKDG